MQQREVFRTSPIGGDDARPPIDVARMVQTELVIEVWLQYVSQLGKHSRWLKEQQSVLAQTEAETERRIDRLRKDLDQHFSDPEKMRIREA